jgi:Clostripain family
MSKKTKKDWTIMVYMAGDNNLSEDMVTGLMGMKKCLEATFNANVAFLAYYDTGALSFPTVKCDFTKETNGKGSDDFFVQNSNLNLLPTITADQNEKTSETSIYRFVKWCVNERNHKAENYALIFSGHGDGFQEASFLRDDHPFGFLTIPGLQRVLKAVTKKLLGKNLSILGFDSCVMSTLEVAYEMSDVADILISSQGFVPNAGWDYGRVVEKLSKKSGGGIKLSKEVVTRVFVKSFIEKYRDYSFYSGRSVDIGFCDLTKAEEVAESVYELGARLEKALKSKNRLLIKKIERALLSAHFKCQTFVYEQCVDIKDFCGNLQEECEAILDENDQIIKALKNSDGKNVKEFVEMDKTISKISDACKNTVKDLNKCVRQSLYLGSEFQFSNGLSLFFPWSYISFILAKGQYLSRDFAIGSKKRNKEKTGELSGWTSFLETYLKKTLRPVRQHSKEEFFLFDLNRSNINVSDEEVFKLNPPFDKLNASFGDKLNASFGDKLNASFGDKLNASFGDKLLASIINSFGRTKNFPWAPTLWQPSDAVLEDDEK